MPRGWHGKLRIQPRECWVCFAACVCFVFIVKLSVKRRQKLPPLDDYFQCKNTHRMMKKSKKIKTVGWSRPRKDMSSPLAPARPVRKKKETETDDTKKTFAPSRLAPPHRLLSNILSPRVKAGADAQATRHFVRRAQSHPVSLPRSVSCRKRRDYAHAPKPSLVVLWVFIFYFSVFFPPRYKYPERKRRRRSALLSRTQPPRLTDFTEA